MRKHIQPTVNGEPYYEDMSEAFSDCREKGSPMRCVVLGVRFKLYPSGRADGLPPKVKPPEPPPATAADLAKTRESLNALNRMLGG